MGKMKSWVFYRKDESEEKEKGKEIPFVIFRDSFSWLMLICPPAWAAFHGFWAMAAGFACLQFLQAILVAGGNSIFSILMIGFNFIVAYEAFLIFDFCMNRRQFHRKGLVRASNYNEAVMQCLCSDNK
jgi:hypothetical protein